MSRRRFYAAPKDIADNVVALSADESHHLMRVLRLTTGEEAFVFDGQGNEYWCRFVGVRGKRAVLEIIESLTDVVESPLPLTLAQALAKGEKFDFIVQKATELGVHHIIPLATEHADIKLNEQQASKRLERWQRISLEALKQCGRRKLVEIMEPISLADFLAIRAAHSLIYFNERGGANLQTVIDRTDLPRSVVAIVGPEGGWSEAEIDLMNERGCKAVSLGRRIYRTETAAIVALTLLQYDLGDLSNEYLEESY